MSVSIGMKHRWVVIAAVTATVVLGACTPADSGVQESSAGPASTGGETSAAEPSATATPYSIDDGY